MTLSLRERATRRARFLSNVRAFFDIRSVLEVDTPLLCEFGITDPAIENIVTTHHRHLQTSPEFAMKRLLSAGIGDCFQICKAFRAEELGRWHREEFTILEWYRLGFDANALIGECLALLQHLSGESLFAKTMRYGDWICDYAGIEDWRDSVQVVGALKLANIDIPTSILNEHNALLDLLIATVIVPKMRGIHVIYPFPEDQASLAVKTHDGYAERFEIYWDNVELANGFYELTDSDEQLARFQADQRERSRNGQPARDIDHRFIESLPNLPSCAGVAIGLDRLLAKISGAASLDEHDLFEVGTI
ncbi:MAG: EF-P lysine aminoacylase GenX [Gammaproteobacteria bacterium]|nr:EF-P lysine aminoacylase GenX [Gammaproteobacteria bacterium]